MLLEAFALVGGGVLGVGDGGSGGKGLCKRHARVSVEVGGPPVVFSLREEEQELFQLLSASERPNKTAGKLYVRNYIIRSWEGSGSMPSANWVSTSKRYAGYYGTLGPPGFSLTNPSRRLGYFEIKNLAV